MADHLALTIEPARHVQWPGGGGFQPIAIRVNGVELIELVRRIELPYAEAEYDERIANGDTEDDTGPRGGIAGEYLYLPASLMFLPSRNLFGAPYRHGFAGGQHERRSLLLQCTCGITDCWFLLATIAVDADRVTWSGFTQFHRKSWSYDALGPFIFDRAAYEAELQPR